MEDEKQTFCPIVGRITQWPSVQAATPSRNSPFQQRGQALNDLQLWMLNNAGVQGQTFNFAYSVSKLEIVSLEEEKTKSLRQQRRRDPTETETRQKNDDVRRSKSHQQRQQQLQKQKQQQQQRRKREKKERGYCEMCEQYFENLLQVRRDGSTVVLYWESRN